MRTRRFFLTGFLLLALAVPAALARDGYELFQQALRKERAEGDCQQAIPLYERVVREAKQNRSLAAQALVRAGECHEKLGQDAARAHYQRVVTEFADQKEQAGIARSRLAGLTPAAPAPSKELLVRQVWAEDGIADTTGAPSPDGRYISFVHWKTANLAVRDLRNGTSRDLTDEGTWNTPDQFAYHSTWSPDGQQIAYTWVKVRVNERKAAVDEPELRMVALGGGKPRTIYRDTNVRWIQPRAFTTDGKEIIASTVSRTDQKSRLVAISVAGGAVRTLRTFEEGDAITVSLSPDGRAVLYDLPEHAGKPQRDVHMLATDGSSDIKVVRDQANDYGALWMPQGDGFVFASDREGAVGLWLQKMNDGRPDGAPRLIKPDMGRMVPLGFSRSGSLFYGYASFQNAGDVFSASFDFENGKLEKPGERILHRYVSSNTSAAYSPDGTQLAFLSRRGTVPYGPGSWFVVVQNLQNGEDRTLEIPSLEQVNNPRRAPLRWSPDGRSLVISGRSLGGIVGLFRLNLEDGSAAHVGRGSWPQFSPDGASLFYTNGQRLIRRDVASGEEHVLVEDAAQMGALAFAVSPDGTQVAHRFISGAWSATTDTLAKDQASGIRLLMLESGESRELVRFLRQDKECPNTMVDWRTGMTWTPDGRYVIFGRGGGDSDTDKIELWQVAADSGKARRILSGTKMIRDLSVHPDGKRISYTVNPAFQAEVWVMENLSPES
jgi:Tol biopolymer transport system component